MYIYIHLFCGWVSLLVWRYYSDIRIFLKKEMAAMFAF